MHIVVFQKDDSVADIGSTCKLEQFFDQLFALIIFGMGFAGENKLNRIVFIVDDRLQAFFITQQQIGPFIGCKAAGKSNG